MKAQVSIAMTTYNGELYLPRQLESIRAQSRAPDELVICDDGSTDATMAILTDFARSAPFDVRVVRNEANLGHELNFSQAIKLARGDIVFLSDQDDAWLPSKLERVGQVFASDPSILVVINDMLITDAGLQSTGRTVLGQLRASGMAGRNAKSMIRGCATAIRAPLKALVLPVPALGYGHDLWIHEFAEFLGARRVLSEVLQLYRRHEANASDWMFDGTQRASPLELARPTIGKNLTFEYERRIAALLLMRQRVDELGHEGFDRLGAPKPYQAVLDEISRATEAIQRRIEVFRRGSFARKALAARLLVTGDYRYFLGWRSFVKDLVR